MHLLIKHIVNKLVKIYFKESKYNLFLNTINLKTENSFKTKNLYT